MWKSIALTTAALVLVLLGPGSQPARADLRAEFQKGCESGHGSYVENVGNVQCNTSGGTTITCDYKITHCSVSAQATYTKIITESGGALQEYLNGKSKVDVPRGWTLVKSKTVESRQQSVK
ncbi:MAG TPA: hypothetical protein VGN17_06230 [Bryobacteraceae bacterium]|jgi:hypothetical protein